MLLGNEEKFMEIVKASVVEEDDKHYIRIEVEDGPIDIPISENEPNEVKSAFNSLILRLKKGIFQLDIGEVGQDLFSQVAKEYIQQLNSEIQEIHGEMDTYELLE